MTFEPPLINWDATPGDAARLIDERKNPADRIWLRRARIELKAQRRELGTLTKETAPTATAICQRDGFIDDVEAELSILDDLRRIGEHERMRAEEAELKQAEAERRERAQQIIPAEQQHIEHERAREAERQIKELFTKLVGQTAEQGVPLRSAQIGVLVAFAAKALFRTASLDSRVMNLEELAKN